MNNRGQIIQLRPPIILLQRCEVRFELGCQVFHHCLPDYLSDGIERIHRHVVRIIFPDCKYRDALARATPYDWRSKLCAQLFDHISNNVNNKLAALLPLKVV